MNLDEPLAAPPLPAAARYFIHAVSALVFAGMLAFGAWIVIADVSAAEAHVRRMLGGLLIASGAGVLIGAVYRTSRAGDLYHQHRRGFTAGMCMVMMGIGLVTSIR